jgi:3-hydroxyisobutyrate dehydrogenase
MPRVSEGGLPGTRVEPHPGQGALLAAEGTDLAETPADAVRDAAFVITMLTDAAAVLAVTGQAAESVADGAVWLQTSMSATAWSPSPGSRRTTGSRSWTVP